MILLVKAEKHYIFATAEMAELVDALDSKSSKLDFQNKKCPNSLELRHFFLSSHKTPSILYEHWLDFG